MTTDSIGRRAFLAGTAATLMAACRGDDDRADAPPTTSSPPTSQPSTQPPTGLALKGVNYYTEREIWRPDYVRRELETIRRDLHCNAVFLLGSDLQRLTQSAAIAADNGLHVWFEPRHFDSDADTTINFVATVARAAEELRTQHRQVALRDVDMAGFGIVKCYPRGHELAYDRTGHFEPKAAFGTVAARFR